MFDKFLQAHQPDEYPVNYRRFSILSGCCGLLMLFFFFPGGMYLAFFLGMVGVTAAILCLRAGGRLCVSGLVLSGICMALSLALYLMLLSFYELVRDPELGPRFTSIFVRLLEESNLSVQDFLAVMGR